MTTMTTVTPAQTVERLGELAQALDTLAARGITGFSLRVWVRPDSISVFEQAGRVSMVDSLASELGLTPELVRTTDRLWSHEARTDACGVEVVVTTYVDPPAQRCACGAVCSHQRA